MLLRIPTLARAHANANANLHRPAPLALLARRHLASAEAPRTTPPLALASQRSEAHELGRAAIGRAAIGRAATPAAPAYQAKPTRAVTERAKKIVAYHQQYKCSGCAKLLPPNYEIDHIVPVALGGHNGLENLQALCRVCHVGKTREQRHDILDAAVAASGVPGASGAAARTHADPEPTKQPSSHRPEGGGPSDSSSESGSSGASVPPPLGLTGLEASALRILHGMNEQQLAAVVCSDRHVRLSAGPGTGKTRALTARIAYLIHRGYTRPHRVLALTFTNRAAQEMRSRLGSLLGPQRADKMTIGTFHSLCLALLRVDIERLNPELPYRRGFAVYDESQALKLVVELLKAWGNDAKRVEGGAKADTQMARKVHATISNLKNSHIGPAEYSSKDDADPLVAHFYPLYQKSMLARNAIDYDDMLLLGVRLLRDSPEVRARCHRRFTHVHVDEFQDTNLVQYELIRWLVPVEGGNLFCVGDADQAIYGWRGADPRNLRRLDEDYGLVECKVPPRMLAADAFASPAALERTLESSFERLTTLAQRQQPPSASPSHGVRLRLELNYRSRQGVLDASMAALAPAYRRFPAQQLSLQAATEARDARVEILQASDSQDEATVVVDRILRAQATSTGAWPSVGVLYRTNSQATFFETELIRQGVAYRLMRARAFFQRAEVRDAMAYLRLIHSDDHSAVERIINVPPRRIGKVAQEVLLDAATANNMTLWETVALATAPDHEQPKELQRLSAVARRSLTDFHSMIERYRDVARSAARPSSDEGDDDRLVLPGSELLMRAERASHRAELSAGRYGSKEGVVGPYWSVEGDHDSGGGGASQGGDGFGADTPLDSLFMKLMDEIGYIDWLTEETRRGRIFELSAMTAQYRADELGRFLDRIVLISDLDESDSHGALSNVDEKNKPPVKLMTIHAAKGLEFDHVYVVGAEEGLLPHYFSERPDELEEERRLLYVAMTRARHAVCITYADERQNYNSQWRACTSSRFLASIPEVLAARTKSKSLAAQDPPRSMFSPT